MRSGNRVRVDQQGFTLAELLVVMAIVALIMAGLLTLLKTGNESYLRGANQVETQSAVRAALERITQEVREAGYNPQGLPACALPLVPPACLDPIVNATATSFTIQNDWNGSGAIQVPCPAPTCDINYVFGGVNTAVRRGEQVTYSVVGGGVNCQVAGNGNFRRQESDLDAQPQILVTSVGQACVGALQPFFEYRDANGNILNPIVASPNAGANQDLIRTVEVNLRVGVQNTAPVFWQAGAVQVTMSDRIRLRNRIP